MASFLLRSRGCIALRTRFPVKLGSKITNASPSRQAYQAQRSLTNTSTLRNAAPRSPRVRAKYDSRGVSKPASPPSPPPPPPPPLGQEAYTPASEQETKISAADLIVGSIIGACTAIFVYETYNSGQYHSNLPEMSKSAEKRMESFGKHMTLSLRNWEEGRWWTTTTSAFTHVSVFHLGANMFGLWALGRGLCQLVGPGKFSLIYLGSGIAGNLLQLYMWKRGTRDPYKHQVAFGASGAVLGLLGTLSVILPTYAMSLWFIPMKMWQATAFTVVSSGVCMAEGWLPQLGHAAHLGGTLFGMGSYVMMVLLSLRGRRALPKINAGGRR